MATFIMLANFTDQGIRNIKDTTRLADSFINLAKTMDVTVTHVYWTLGPHDIVAILDGPDDMAVTALALALGKMGNVRSQTLKAFSKADMSQILGKVV